MKNLCIATGILHIWLTNRARNPDMDALWNFTDMSKYPYLGDIYGCTRCYDLVDIKQKMDREGILRRDRIFQIRRP